MTSKIANTQKTRLAVWLCLLALDCFLIARAHQSHAAALRLAVLYLAALYAVLNIAYLAWKIRRRI